MQQTLTAKLQIIPKSSDRQVLLDTMRAYSAACSYVSGYVHEHGHVLKRIVIHNAVYRTCRNEYALPSQMAASVIRTVIAAYKTVRTNQARYSKRFSKKKHRADIRPSFQIPQLSLVWNRDYSLVWNTDKTERLFSINTLRGRINQHAPRTDQMSLPFGCNGMGVRGWSKIRHSQACRKAWQVLSPHTRDH